MGENNTYLHNTEDAGETVVNSEGKKKRRRRRRRRNGKTNRDKNTFADSMKLHESDCASSCSEQTAALHINDQLTGGLGKQRKFRKNKKKSIERSTYFADDVSDHVKSLYVGLDAEMVGTGADGSDSALARVSIVDWSGEPIFDTFVRVEEMVTDYRTHVSGITPNKIQSKNAISFEECRKIVLEIIKDKVLVGHGLKNDLKVLNIHHPWHDIRDTARYEPLMRADVSYPGIYLPRKLKELAQEYLNMTIQKDGDHHCSIEDAKAAMMVYRSKRSKWEKAVEWKIQKTRYILSCSSDSSSAH